MSNARLDRSRPASVPAGGAIAGINPPSMGHPSPVPTKVPPVDEALVRHLEGAFKFTPSASHDLRALDRAVGHRQVIDHLWALHHAQQNE